MALICFDCVKSIKNNPISGKKNKYKWFVLSSKPLDVHVWTNCEKCQSWKDGQRFEAKVIKV